jgi:hypothetical protein
MAGQNKYNPGNRKETPEEKIDRLIKETEKSMGRSSCEDLQAALESISPDDIDRLTRANNVLTKCRKNRYLT